MNQFLLNIFVIVLCFLCGYQFWLLNKQHTIPSKTTKDKKKNPVILGTSTFRDILKDDKTRKKTGTNLMAFTAIQVYSRSGIKKFPLVIENENEFIIGSNSDCDIALDSSYSPYLSEKHCSIYQRDDGLFELEDLSTNGTFLITDGKEPERIERIVLEEGMELYLANLRIRITRINPFDSAYSINNEQKDKQNQTKNESNSKTDSKTKTWQFDHLRS